MYDSEGDQDDGVGARVEDEGGRRALEERGGLRAWFMVYGLGFRV